VSWRLLPLQFIVLIGFRHGDATLCFAEVLCSNKSEFQTVIEFSSEEKNSIAKGNTWSSVCV